MSLIASMVPQKGDAVERLEQERVRGGVFVTEGKERAEI